MDIRCNLDASDHETNVWDRNQYDKSNACWDITITFNLQQLNWDAILWINEAAMHLHEMLNKQNFTHTH